MLKITVISNADAQISNVIDDLEGLDIVWSEHEKVLPDTSCVLISQTYAGERLADLLQAQKNNGIPAAVLTNDRSDENQEALLDLGAAHVIFLPVKQSLLKKKIISIANQATEQMNAGFDFFAQIADTNQQIGAFVVPERDFSTIYRFVQRLQDRLDKQAQLMIFRFHSRLHTPVEPGTLETTVPIVQKCLRRGDIVSINGQTITAILMGTDPAGAQGAANRILATYEAYCCDSMFSMNYEIKLIAANT